MHTCQYYASVCLEGLRKFKKNSSLSRRRPGRQEPYRLSQFTQWSSPSLLTVVYIKLLPACILSTVELISFLSAAETLCLKLRGIEDKIRFQKHKKVAILPVAP